MNYLVSITDIDNKKHKALGIFDYHASDITPRIVDQAYFKTSLVDKPIK
jgi:hypothetical protein